jgi:hypothetical protein
MRKPSPPQPYEWNLEKPDPAIAGMGPAKAAPGYFRGETGYSRSRWKADDGLERENSGHARRGKTILGFR